MNKKTCLNCNKEVGVENYCDWNCHVEYAKKQGGIVHSPNNLPVGCIKFDGSMWEHEHGDHPDYKFPVDVKYVGNIKAKRDVQEDFAMYGRKLTTKEFRESLGETHALLYANDSVALTIYECNYVLWDLRDGNVKAGNMWKKGEWSLTPQSVEKIKKYVSKRS